MRPIRNQITAVLRNLAVAAFSALILRAGPENEVVLNINPTPEQPRNEPGGFVTLKSGRIVCYFGQIYGGDYDWSAGRIAEIHSDDQGRTWSAPRVAIDNGENLNLMCASPLRLASGKIALFYCLKKSEIDVRTCFRLSSDEGASWSEAKDVSDAIDDVEGRDDCAIQTRYGRIIVPLSSYRVISRVDNGLKSIDPRGIVFWAYSDDDGRNWQESPTWWTLPSIDPSGALCLGGLEEPGIVELADGSLFSWARSDQGVQYGFRSRDGDTGVPLKFSPPEPTELKSPFAPADIKRLPNSNLLLAVWNDHSGRFPFPKGIDQGRAQDLGYRTPLVAGISDDGGKTWPRRRVLEGDLNGKYSYPAIHFVKDHVLIEYAAEDAQYPQHLGRLRIRRIAPSWLLQAPAGP